MKIISSAVSRHRPVIKTCNCQLQSVLSYSSISPLRIYTHSQTSSYTKTIGGVWFPGLGGYDRCGSESLYGVWDFLQERI